MLCRIPVRLPSTTVPSRTPSEHIGAPAEGSAPDFA